MGMSNAFRMGSNFDSNDVDFMRFEDQNYASIVITYANIPLESKRYEFLENCVNAIHKHANYPFEIIVVDDSGISLSSLNVKDKVSVILLNMGKNAGQSVQINRGVSVASGKCIVVMEDDLEMQRPCLKEFADILEKPYVGFLNVETEDRPGEYLENNGTKFVIGGSLGGACLNVFRKDVWKQIGGYPEWSHSSHPPFCLKILKSGWWRAYLIGSRVIRDVDHEDWNDTRSTFLCGREVHYPKLFAISESEQDRASSERSVINHQNYDRRGQPGTVCNFPYWRDYANGVTSNVREKCVSSINWQAAEQYGQAKWKDMILAEQIHNA